MRIVDFLLMLQMCRKYRFDQAEDLESMKFNYPSLTKLTSTAVSLNHRLH